MKRYIVLLITLMLGSICSAQPTSFYGLKLGEKYSLEEMVSAVGENGVYSKSERHHFTDEIELDTFFSQMLNMEIISSL